MAELTQPKKTAVILFNLGGPTGPETIQPFLYNFFMDKNIIPFPKPLRYFFAYIISRLRSRREAGEAYGEMGGQSPLLENTFEQAKALEKALSQRNKSHDYRSYVCMRYWHPMSESVAAQVQSYNPDRVVLISLYPQFSTTTAWSSLENWKKACQKIGFSKEFSFVCCYPTASGYINASAEKIRKVYEKARKQAEKNNTAAPRILFSAHSLPEAVIEKGDPYQWQCEQTAQAIIDALNIDDLDYQLCYQSKVGPQKWIGPQTEDVIKESGKQGVPLVIYPHSFVSEHVETIVELGVEYKHLAKESGVPDYSVVETVGAHPLFVDMLADFVEKYSKESGIYCEDDTSQKKECPEKYTRCCKKCICTENQKAAQV